jgi:hypothetical protein
MSLDFTSSRLARASVGIIVAGFFVFLIGLFPGLIQLDVTSGLGILQIATFNAGITLMTIGAYIYMYATRHRALPPRLREDVGLRLMATGVVICYVTGFADILGIGTHFGANGPPLFGLLQAGGVSFGVCVIVVGIGVYSRR